METPIIDGKPTISDVAVNLGTEEIVVGSVNRASGTLSIEIGGTSEIDVTSTTVTLGGNLVLPSSANIGPSGDTDLLGMASGTITVNGNLNIANGTAPSAHVDDQTILYSKDSAGGGATLGIFTEAAVVEIGTFTASHKIPVWINGTEYHIQLDAV